MSRLAALATVALVLAPTAARAWKPSTHIHLAQEAWKDARDGRVTIYTVDYETGRIGAPLGEYEVDVTVRKAIEQFPASFFAGVIGPDAYPDIITGQMRIHPPAEGEAHDSAVNTHGGGPVPWFEQVWNAAFRAGTGDVIAFAAGYLIHAAGDYYAHTYVNHYTGRTFTMDDNNGAKHMVLESYLGQRTPPLAPIDLPRVGPVDAYKAVGEGGLTPAIRQLVAEHLRDIGHPHEKNRTQSLPWYFHELRASLVAAELGYRRHEASLRAPLGDLGAGIALLHRARDWACDVTQSAPCPIDGVSPAQCPSPYREGRAPNPLACGIAVAAFEVAFAHAGPVLLPWHAFVTTYAPIVHHVRKHVRAIDDGLVRWVETSHRIAMALLFNPSGADLAGATAELRRFAPALVSMTLGIDPRIVQLIDAVGTLRPPHPSEVVSKVANAAVDAGFRALYGASPEELVRQIVGAHSALDLVFGAPVRSRVNADLALPDQARAMRDIEAGQPQRFDYRAFAPALNTVTLVKLALLSPAELQRVFDDLARRTGSPVQRFATTTATGAPANLLLTFGRTLDGSHQWIHGFPLGTDCRIYKTIFAKVKGPASRGVAHPSDPADTCQPAAPVTWQASATVLLPGETATLTFAEPVRLVDDTATGGVPAACTVRGASCIATITAPSVAAGGALDRDLRITAIPTTGGDPRRRATISLRLLAPLVVTARPVATPAGLDVMAAAGTLRAGSRLVLDVQPALRVRWTVSGTGTLGDPVRAAELARDRAARASALSAAEAELVRARETRARCGVQPGCLATATAAIERAVASVSAAASAVLEIDVELEELARTYVAPAALAAPAAVTIAARTDDGRSAQLELEVRPAWPALRLAEAVRSVRAGTTLELHVVPATPMRWAVTRGAGSIGSRPRADLDRELATIARGVPASARVPAIAPRARATRTPRALADARRVEQLLAHARQHFPALTRAGREQATYVAPARQLGTSAVRLTGVAQDGSDRVIVVDFEVTPNVAVERDVPRPPAPSAAPDTPVRVPVTAPR